MRVTNWYIKSTGPEPHSAFRINFNDGLRANLMTIFIMQQSEYLGHFKPNYCAKSFCGQAWDSDHYWIKFTCYGTEAIISTLVQCEKDESHMAAILW